MFKVGQRYRFYKNGGLGDERQKKWVKCRGGAYPRARTVCSVPDAFRKYVWRTQQLCGIILDE